MTYLQLIQRHPLRMIRNKKDFEKASKVADEIASKWGNKISRDESEYMHVLVLLMIEYERQYKFPVDPVELLRYLMKENGMTQAELARKISVPESTVSAILSKKREMNVNIIKKLSGHFSVCPSLFINRWA